MIKRMQSRARFIALAGVLSVTTSLPVFAEESAPQINAAGTGMTNEQLLETRPVLSGLKSVNEAQAAVSELRTMAQEIVKLCTKKLADPVAGLEEGDGDFYSTRNVTTRMPFKTSGKYSAVSRMRLMELHKSIDKQRGFLAEIIQQNQQDKRTLRAAETSRDEIERLRAEAQANNRRMLVDAERVSQLTGNPTSNQAELADAARVLVSSADAVSSKLKQMEKTLKKAK